MERQGILHSSARVTPLPKPTYILCAESTSHDIDSGEFSIFNVIEKIVITPIKPADNKPLIVEFQKMRIVSSWMRDESEPAGDYECHNQVFLPGLEKPIGGGTVTFRFDKPFFRVTAKVDGALPFKDAGLMKIEAGIRKVGDTDWIKQSCVVIIDNVPVSDDSKPTKPE